VTSSSENVARRYFDALGAQDLDAAVACWRPGGTGRIVGQTELTAPDGIRAYFSELFAAFPDFKFEVLDVLESGDRTAIRWHARATFAGPGTFQGYAPNGAKIDIEGCDVITASEGLIDHNDAYLDGFDTARQLGVLPPPRSAAEARLTKLANARTKVRTWVHGGASERIADGVWIVRGGFPQRTMNVFLLEDDGGAVEIAGTVKEGDEIAGFKVVELPGHAPGLIGLFRESDRLALVSDLVYTLDPQTWIKGAARLPHPAFNIDTEQARASIRKLAALSPSTAWPGHADPVRGDVAAQLEHAASAST
jgi:predicted ester cyclase